MSESLNICVSCGLCCDGTLIGFVQLLKEDPPELKELIQTEEGDENGFFLLPCDKLSCDGCTIYSQRPKQCGNFNCNVLKSVQKKELDVDAAMEVIDLIKQKKIAIEKQLATLKFELKSKSFYFKILELRKLFGNEQHELSSPQNHQQLIADIKEIDKLVTASFGVSF